SAGSRVGRLTTGGGLRLYRLPRGMRADGAVTAAGDGRLWFVDRRQMSVGRIGASGRTRGYRVPGRPISITRGPDSATVWTSLCTEPAVPTFRLTHSGAPYVELTCPRFTLRYCAGSIELRSETSGLHLGTGHFVMHPFDNPRVRVKLSGRAVRLVRRWGQLTVDATIDAHDAAGLRRVIHSRLALAPA